MIVIRMSGGLGNQMFQYALYVKLLSLGREVVFDDRSQYDEEAFRSSAQKRRPKRLDIFGIDYPTVSDEDLKRITDSAMDPISRIRRKISGRKSLEKDDQDFIYDPSFLEAEEGYFCGNFQSARYFEGAEEEVRRAFTFPEDILSPREGVKENSEEGGRSPSGSGDPQQTHSKTGHRVMERTPDAAEAERKMLTRAADYERRIHEANERYDRSRQPAQKGRPVLPSLYAPVDGRAAGRRTSAGAGGAARGDGSMSMRCDGRTDSTGTSFRGGTASIHLRFGDYLDKQEIYGGICTDAYYNAAIEHLKALDPEMTFFVFSNDRSRAGEWVRMQAEKEENRGRSRFVLVKGSDEDHGYLDLYLMSRCRNHIIANSSFSWWAAWLCDNPGKITFAPSIWNNHADGSELRRTDIYDRGMRRINPQGHEITERPSVSVIMAAYNVAPYVKRAVESVCAQTYRNLELIAVDDGSTDGTGAILDACAEEDARIHVIHQANAGVSAARNAGLHAAAGDYIGFVDADDAADPQMYEIMLRGMLESGADLCTVRYREVKPEEDAADVLEATLGGNTASEGAASGRGSAADNARMRPPADAEGVGDAADTRDVGSDGDAADAGSAADDIRQALRSGIVWDRRRAICAYIHSGMEGADSAVVFHSAVWSKLFRRQLLDGGEFPEGTSAEDIPFTTQALCRSRRVLYLPEALYSYTVRRADSLMTSHRAHRTLTEEIPAWQTHLTMLREIGESELAEESEYYYWRRLLAYEEDYRRCSGVREEAEQLEEYILQNRDRILELTGQNRTGRRGDHCRLRLYVNTPRLYRALSLLYEKTYVAWRNR